MPSCSALSLNPANAIATRLLAEVRKQRALTDSTARERATTGFSAREFALLESHAPDDAVRLLKPRIDALFDSINATSVAGRIVQARQREGQNGSKLFFANSCHPAGKGHIYAYHHGGRWEPQFNLGWFSSPPLSSCCVRIGIGFNCSQAGQDPDRSSGHEQVLAVLRTVPAERSTSRGSVSSRSGWPRMPASSSTPSTSRPRMFSRSAPSNGC